MTIFGYFVLWYFFICVLIKKKVQVVTSLCCHTRTTWRLYDRSPKQIIFEKYQFISNNWMIYYELKFKGEMTIIKYVPRVGGGEHYFKYYLLGTQVVQSQCCIYLQHRCDNCIIATHFARLTDLVLVSLSKRESYSPLTTRFVHDIHERFARLGKRFSWPFSRPETRTILLQRVQCHTTHKNRRFIKV